MSRSARDLAAANDAKLLMNVCDLSGYVASRLDSNAPVRHDGRIAPPEGPGLGVTPDLDLLGTPDAVFD